MTLTPSLRTRIDALLLPPDELAVIKGLEPPRQMDALLAHALSSATQIAASGHNPTHCAIVVVAYLGLARELASSAPVVDGLTPLGNKYQASVYGILDYARERAAQRMRVNSGVFLKGVEMPEGDGHSTVLTSAEQIRGEARTPLSVLSLYKV